ncbi:MAG TPA: response regulator [Burkholderiales bacterium]|jgi:CheY-like chemotaxis protein|nr:response regulator [Burkholderiales bacterium]
MQDLREIEILLAEDSASDAEMALRALKKSNLANSVTWVRDGVEALEFIFGTGKFSGRSGNPKLVMLDIKMPRVDGIEVLRQMRADERTRLIPAVILTSSAEERDIMESYKLGVNSYIVKPVDFSQFAQVVVQVGLYWAVVNRTPST